MTIVLHGAKPNRAGPPYGVPAVLVVHDPELDLVRIPNGAVDADRLDRRCAPTGCTLRPVCRTSIVCRPTRGVRLATDDSRRTSSDCAID